MSDYRVLAHRSDKLLRQRFYLTILAANGQVLFTSEQYRDKDYAIEQGQKITAALDGNFIDET